MADTNALPSPRSIVDSVASTGKDLQRIRGLIDRTTTDDQNYQAHHVMIVDFRLLLGLVEQLTENTRALAVHVENHLRAQPSAAEQMRKPAGGK